MRVQTRGTDGASSDECASGTGGRGAAPPRGQFCFQARTFAESPADTSGAQQAGLSKGSKQAERSCGGGRQDRRHGRARLLPNARAAPVGVELHCRAASLCFQARTFAESPADTSGALQAGLSNGSGYGGKFCGGGRETSQTSGTDGAVSAECGATPASVELHRCAVSFVIKRGRSAESPADTSGALQAGLSKRRRRDERSCGGGQTSGMDGVSSAKCASNTGGRRAASLRGQFCFQVRCALHLPRTRAAHCKQAC